MIRFLQSEGKAKKIVLGGLLLVICGAMVITLVPGGILGDSFGGASGQGVLAKVGNQEVTLPEAQQSVRQMLQQRFGNQSGQAQQLIPLLLPQAVQSLIDQKALIVEADRMGLRVGDAEVAYWLQHGPFSSVLFPGGQFIGSDRYEEFAERNLNMTVPQLEQAIKTDLLLTKLRAVVEGGATVTDDDVHQQFVKQNTKVKFQYAVLDSEDVMKQIRPTDAELKAYYEKNLKAFENSIPEKRSFQYVVIDPSSLKNKVQVTTDELQSYYNSHMDQYRVPEEVKVRHILIKTPAPGPDNKVDPKAVEAARAKAQEILNKIKAGANFAALAKTDSDDPGSAKDGGELGWIGRGRTVPEFEKAAFSLAPGQTSDLVQSSYGFHIIQVEDKHAARLKPLDEVKADIAPEIAQEKATQMAETLANSVQAQARTSNLAAAAAKNGLEVMSSTLVPRTASVPGIGQSTDLMTAVFSAPEKNPPELVRLLMNFAVFQVTQIQPPSTPSFEDAKDNVETDFKRERASQLLAQKIQELSDRAHATHDLSKAAAETGAKLETSDLVTPDSQVPEIGSLSGAASQIFDLKIGEISEPINTGRGGAVAMVLDRQEPPAGDFEAQKDQIRDRLLAEKRQQIFEMFVDTVRQRLEKEGKIRINKQEMDRLLPKPEAS